MHHILHWEKTKRAGPGIDSRDRAEPLDQKYRAFQLPARATRYGRIRVSRED